jgi:hypothetical protein
VLSCRGLALALVVFALAGSATLLAAAAADAAAILTPARSSAVGREVGWCVASGAGTGGWLLHCRRDQTCSSNALSGYSDGKSATQ